MASTTSKVALAALASGIVVGFYPLRDALNTYTTIPTSSGGYVLGAAFVAVVLSIFAAKINLVWQFIWNCFLQPLGKNADQAGRLNRFYQGQAES